MFSTCSELTARAPILDGRMAQFMQPWSFIAEYIPSFPLQVSQKTEKRNCLFKDLKKLHNDVMRDCDLQGKEGQKSALR